MLGYRITTLLMEDMLKGNRLVEGEIYTPPSK
jgi:hypothetical protein